jgi:hypothetical protein
VGFSGGKQNGAAAAATQQQHSRKRAAAQASWSDGLMMSDGLMGGDMAAAAAAAAAAMAAGGDPNMGLPMQVCGWVHNALGTFKMVQAAMEFVCLGRSTGPALAATFASVAITNVSEPYAFARQDHQPVAGDDTRDSEVTHTVAMRLKQAVSPAVLCLMRIICHASDCTRPPGYAC